MNDEIKQTDNITTPEENSDLVITPVEMSEMLKEHIGCDTQEIANMIAVITGKPSIIIMQSVYPDKKMACGCETFDDESETKTFIVRNNGDCVEISYTFGLSKMGE